MSMVNQQSYGSFERRSHATIQELRDWIDGAESRPLPSVLDCPLDSVRAIVQETGKLRAPVALLDAIVLARNVALRAGWDLFERLALEALNYFVDKHERRYSYASYVALPMLEALDEGPMELERYRGRVVGTLISLLVELEQFEAASSLGYRRACATHSCTGEAAVARIGAIRAARGAFEGDMRTKSGPPSTLLEEGGGELLRASALESAERLNRMQERTRFVLRSSVLPMSRVHDEHLFIRVLQAFECIFEIAVHAMMNARDLVIDGKVEAAAESVRSGIGWFRRYPSLFRVLATMPPEHFLAFRDDTSGSSAIGSARVKLLEAVSRRIPEEELFGPAFAAVPEVQARCRAGMLTMEDAWDRHAGAGRRRGGLEQLTAALREMDALYTGWRRMHLAIVRHWLGADVRGTGGTEGVRYLEARIAQPLCPYLTKQAA